MSFIVPRMVTLADTLSGATEVRWHYKKPATTERRNKMTFPWEDGGESNSGWVCSEDDILLDSYRQKNLALMEEVARLKREVEYLKDSLDKARHHHELDYQLWLLRDKDALKLRSETPTGSPTCKGYAAVAKAITSTYQKRRTPWAKHVINQLSAPEPSQMENEESDEDPELASTLLRLMEEGIGRK